VVYDLETFRRDRLTVRGDNRAPLWSPDGQSIVFRSDRDGSSQLYMKRVDGVGDVRQLTTDAIAPHPASFTADGTELLMSEGFPSTGWDISVLSLEDNEKRKTLVSTEFVEWQAALSPDGRFIAYTSNEVGGGYQIIVQSYPDGDLRAVASTGGGIDPMWSPGGDSLFFNRTHRGMVVTVDTEDGLRIGREDTLYVNRYLDLDMRSWDLGPDGRFLMPRSVEDDTTSAQLDVVTNLFDLLRRDVPSGGR